MEKQVYEAMLRKPAIWSGPCPACGKPIETGDVIRQPFERDSSGRNRYCHYWLCYPCARQLNGGSSGKTMPSNKLDGVSLH